MIWTRNGNSQPQQSPHTVSKGYVFHGTFNPLKDGDVLSFTDILTFTVDVNGNTGHGNIIVFGNIKQLSTS